jgi:hypothetical protein
MDDCVESERFESGGGESGFGYEFVNRLERSGSVHVALDGTERYGLRVEE